MKKHFKKYLNTVIQGDSSEVLTKIKSNKIDMVVTSPPYDHLKNYEGFNFNFKTFKKIADELYRVMKSGGVVVWVVTDAVIDGDKTGTSLRQVLYFKKIGFKLHDVMIWDKGPQGAFGNKNAYLQCYEHMYVFVKDKLKVLNLIKDRKNLEPPGMKQVRSGRKPDDTFHSKRVITTGAFGIRTNIWKITPEHNNEHPAPFPLKLAHDHILSWSNKDAVVLDPFSGSGTTCAAAKMLHRNYIGIEMSEKYCKKSERRIKQTYKQQFND